MIEIDGVSKRFGAVRALTGVGFTIPDGTVTGFVGPNGAGKTTLMRIVMGLVRADAGRVVIDGRSETAPRTEPRVSALLDAGWAFGRRTAADHLWMLAAARGLPRRRVTELLELTGLSAVAERRVGTFSLGMKQRLGIATALLGDTRSLLLDEPVNGLDPDGVHWVRCLVRDLAGRGVAVLVSSHLLSELSLTADRIVLIAGGRIRAEGPLEEFLSDGADATVVASDDTWRLGEICRAAGALVEPVDQDRIVVRGMTPPEVCRAAFGAGIVLTHLEQRTASLEERFVALTGAHAAYRAEPAGPDGRITGGEP